MCFIDFLFIFSCKIIIIIIMYNLYTIYFCINDISNENIF